MYIEVWQALDYGCGIPAMFHYFVHVVFLELSGSFGDSFYGVCTDLYVLTVFILAFQANRTAEHDAVTFLPRVARACEICTS